MRGAAGSRPPRALYVGHGEGPGAAIPRGRGRPEPSPVSPSFLQEEAGWNSGPEVGVERGWQGVGKAAVCACLRISFKIIRECLKKTKTQNPKPSNPAFVSWGLCRMS